MLLYKITHEIVLNVQCNMIILKLLSAGKLTFSDMLVVEHDRCSLCMVAVTIDFKMEMPCPYQN